MDQQQKIARLSEHYQDQCHAIRQRMETYGANLWDSLPDYHRDTIDGFIEQIVPVVKSGQQALQETTNAYLANYSAAIGEDLPIEPVVLDAIDTGLRGVNPKTVYARPAVATYTSLKHGESLETSTGRGKLRLLQIIGGDAQISRVQQSHKSMRRWRGRHGAPRYYRRTLTGLENCALCVIASTQRYRVDHVQPIHPGCDCGFEPLPLGSYDWVIDEDTLEQAHSAVESLGLPIDRGGRSPDYRKLIVTSEHSEYGTIMQIAPRK